MTGAPFLALAAAGSAGLLVGIERGWHLRGEREGGRVAGVRTFTLLGLGGGVAGMVAGVTPALAISLAVGLVGSILVGHARRQFSANGIDSTSAVAAVVTVGCGVIAGLGRADAAVGGAALVTLVLALRGELHQWLRRLDAEDVKALARFAAIALAVLPFLPDRPMGPYGAWNPTRLWWVVVLVSGFSFLGYVANRLFGARHGTIATALIGGAYSSTAVTQSLAQRLGAGPGDPAANAGIVLASAVMYVRVAALSLLLAPRLSGSLAMLLAAPAVVTGGIGLALLRRAAPGKGAALPGNPIAVMPALGFALFVGLAAVVAAWGQARFGAQGLALLLFLMGAFDVDAALAAAGGLPARAIAAPLAAYAVSGTVLANMLVKVAVAAIYGRRAARPAIRALLASAAALAAVLVLARPTSW